LIEVSSGSFLVPGTGSFCFRLVEVSRSGLRTARAGSASFWARADHSDSGQEARCQGAYSLHGSSHGERLPRTALVGGEGKSSDEPKKGFHRHRFTAKVVEKFVRNDYNNGEGARLKRSGPQTGKQHTRTWESAMISARISPEARPSAH
jgi:hypothetical protein